MRGRRVENPIWLAPEVIANNSFTAAADIYAFGVVLYELFTGLEYFKEARFMYQVEESVLAGERPLIPATVSPKIAKLIEVRSVHACARVRMCVCVFNPRLPSPALLGQRSKRKTTCKRAHRATQKIFRQGACHLPSRGLLGFIDSILTNQRRICLIRCY
jgi:hypothetical protein